MIDRVQFTDTFFGPGTVDRATDLSRLDLRQNRAVKIHLACTIAERLTFRPPIAVVAFQDLRGQIDLMRRGLDELSRAVTVCENDGSPKWLAGDFSDFYGLGNFAHTVESEAHATRVKIIHAADKLGRAAMIKSRPISRGQLIADLLFLIDSKPCMWLPSHNTFIVIWPEQKVTDLDTDKPIGLVGPLMMCWEPASDGQPGLRASVVDNSPRDLVKQNFGHPHVATDGSPCMGGYRVAFQNALADGRLLDSYELLSRMMESYSNNTAYWSIRTFDAEKFSRNSPPCRSCAAIALPIVDCNNCGASACEGCTATCEFCDTHACNGCSGSCPSCDVVFCAACRNDHTGYCDSCGERYCEKHCTNCECGSGSKLCTGCREEYGGCNNCRQGGDDDDEEEEEEEDDVEAMVETIETIRRRPVVRPQAITNTDIGEMLAQIQREQEAEHFRIPTPATPAGWPTPGVTNMQVRMRVTEPGDPATPTDPAPPTDPPPPVAQPMPTYTYMPFQRFRRHTEPAYYTNTGPTHGTGTQATGQEPPTPTQPPTVENPGVIGEPAERAAAPPEAPGF